MKWVPLLLCLEWFLLGVVFTLIFLYTWQLLHP